MAGEVALGSKPEAGAADGKGHIFVNLQEKDASPELIREI